MSTPSTVRIDFVSDISCPWCAIGLASLQQALESLGDDVATELHFRPFELNPQMVAGGQDAMAYQTSKHGRSEAEINEIREMIRVRGAELGVTFNIGSGTRVYNTFDAHRLLHWAGLEGRGLALKQALLHAYFTDGKNISDHETLAQLATAAGLDGARTRQILGSDTYADDVRIDEQFFTQRGIRSVPSIILNGQHLISGGQPPEVFAQALRQLAAG